MLGRLRGVWENVGCFAGLGARESHRPDDDAHRSRMPRLSTAELVKPVPFPETAGKVIWEERRKVPVGLLFSVTAAVLVALVVSVQSTPGRLVLALATLGRAVLWIRARLRSLIETYTVSDRCVTIEQPDGGRVAIPVETITGIAIGGDAVRVSGSLGVLTLGFLAAISPASRVCTGHWPGRLVERGRLLTAGHVRLPRSRDRPSSRPGLYRGSSNAPAPAHPRNPKVAGRRT